MNKTKYDKTFPKKLIEHMSNGASFESFGAEINVGRTILFKWVKRYKEFAAAKEIAELKAMNYFEKRLILKTSGQDVKGFDHKKIDAGLIQFALRTRFHKVYQTQEKIDHSSSDGSMSPVEQTVIIIPSNSREADE